MFAWKPVGSICRGGTKSWIGRGLTQSKILEVVLVGEDSRVCLVAVGDASKISKQLETFGKVVVVKAD